MESLFIAFIVLLLVIYYLGLGVWVFAGLLLGFCWVIAACLQGFCWVFTGFLVVARYLLPYCSVANRLSGFFASSLFANRASSPNRR